MNIVDAKQAGRKEFRESEKVQPTSQKKKKKGKKID